MLPDHKTNPPGSSPGSATSQVTLSVTYYWTLHSEDVITALPTSQG